LRRQALQQVPNSGLKRGHFEPWAPRPPATLVGVKLPFLPTRRQAPPVSLRPALVAGLLLMAALPQARAEAVGLLPAHLAQVEALAQASARTAGPPGARIEVQLGSPDPRLRLAPCSKTEAYLPPGQPSLGRTRIGLRCLSGATAWNITLPVSIAAFAPAVVVRGAAPAGTVLAAEHLQLADVDWGAGTAFVDGADLIGRELQRPLSAGQALRVADLKTRQWFKAGETVRVVARGTGFSVSSEGQALSHGLEGQTVRVRTTSGRVLHGRAVADRQVEVLL
jgi:flagellar basal body P-ring formation protein FlgA